MKAKATHRRIIAALLGAALLTLQMGEANATATAYASNQISNFFVTSTIGLQPVGTGTAQRNTQNAATYGPASSPGVGTTTQDPQNLGARSDALQATAGPGAFPGQNVFSRITAAMNPGMIGARGDSDTGAGSPFNPTTGDPYVRNVAEARVTTGLGFAAASAGTNSATAAVTFQVSLPAQARIIFDFDNIFSLYAATTALGEGAQGTLSNVFTIADQFGNTLFTYSPAAVNTSCGSNGGFPAECSFSTTAHFTGTSNLLDIGVYTISLLSSSAATAVSRAAVPEPSTAAILGLGLLSLGFIRRRQRG